MADYDITITTLGGAAPADGFIDSKNSYMYIKEAQPAPTTLANAKAKARAYARYKHIVVAMAQFSALGGVISFTPTGGGPNAAHTSVVLRVRLRSAAGLVTNDELNAGQTLTGLAAIERIVARCLIQGQNPYTMEVYDPTTFAPRDTDGADTAARPKLSSIIIDQVGALAASIAAAEAAITVVAV